MSLQAYSSSLKNEANKTKSLTFDFRTRLPLSPPRILKRAAHRHSPGGQPGERVKRKPRRLVKIRVSGVLLLPEEDPATSLDKLSVALFLYNP